MRYEKACELIKDKEYILVDDGIDGFHCPAVNGRLRNYRTEEGLPRLSLREYTKYKAHPTVKYPSMCKSGYHAAAHIPGALEWYVDDTNMLNHVKSFGLVIIDTKDYARTYSKVCSSDRIIIESVHNKSNIYGNTVSASKKILELYDIFFNHLISIYMNAVCPLFYMKVKDNKSVEYKMWSDVLSIRKKTILSTISRVKILPSIVYPCLVEDGTCDNFRRLYRLFIEHTILPQLEEITSDCSEESRVINRRALELILGDDINKISSAICTGDTRYITTSVSCVLKDVSDFFIEALKSLCDKKVIYSILPDISEDKILDYFNSYFDLLVFNEKAHITGKTGVIERTVDEEYSPRNKGHYIYSSCGVYRKENFNTLPTIIVNLQKILKIPRTISDIDYCICIEKYWSLLEEYEKSLDSNIRKGVLNHEVAA